MKKVKIKALEAPKGGKAHKMKVGKVYTVSEDTAKVLIGKKIAEAVK